MARKQRTPRGKPSLKSPPNVPKPERTEVSKKTSDSVEDGTNDDKMDDSSVVCLSHIPHGFYEPQMTKYFSQFGVVKRLRLSRSKKSGRSKGYAFIQFEFPEVAQIVAETMNGYLTYQKIMKCKVIPSDKVHQRLFIGCKQKFRKPWHREASKKRVNSLLTAPADRIHIAQKRRVQYERRKNRKLEELGIDFKCDTLDKEWDNLKGPVPGTKSPKIKWKQRKKQVSSTSPGSGKRKKSVEIPEEVPSLKKSKSEQKEKKQVLEDNSSEEEQSPVPSRKPPPKLSLEVEGEEMSDDLSSETSSVLLAESEEPVRTRKKKVSKKVKATSSVGKKNNEIELDQLTPKMVEKVKKNKTPKNVKTPKSVKKSAKRKSSPQTSFIKKTPGKSKTPERVTESTKKVPKTPNSGKGKTPKSGKKSGKKL